MKFIFGIVSGFITFMCWWVLLSNIPHMWKFHHYKGNLNNSLLNKLFTVVMFITCGIIGYFLIKWSAQLLGIIN